jgi:hypothetical protein
VVSDRACRKERAAEHRRLIAEQATSARAFHKDRAAVARRRRFRKDRVGEASLRRSHKDRVEAAHPKSIAAVEAVAVESEPGRAKGSENDALNLPSNSVFESTGGQE